MKETVSYEVMGNYIFCLRYRNIGGTSFCDVYSATSDPSEIDGLVEEKFNLVDVDGTVVDDFGEAQLILSIADVFVHDGELFFSINFNGDYWMNYSELEVIQELFQSSIKQGLKAFMNGEDVENSIEFLNGKL